MDKLQILKAAVALAKTRGYRGVFKRHVAAVLGCGMGTINYHFGTMDALRAEIVREAIRLGDRQIVLQAVALRDPIIWRKNLAPSLREKLDAMTGLSVSA